MPALCEFSGPSYLFFSENVAPLVYYSHLPVMILSLLLGLFILTRGWQELPNRILAVMTFTFAAWVFMDSVFWASNRSDVIMFVWSAIVLIEPLVHVAGLYLLYVLIERRDLPFAAKGALFILYLPLILYAATSYNLAGFDTVSCLADEGFIARYYSYGLEIFSMIAVLMFAVTRFTREVLPEERKKVLSLATGIFLMMFAFSWGNIIGSFTDAWEIAQYGLFGMPLFIIFLLYSIVNFKLFDIKLVGAVALVLILSVLNFALLFVNNVGSFRSVALATFAFSVVFGFVLIRSVNREVRQREMIEEQEKELEIANKEQESLLHFISHEVKGYLTKSQAAFAAILEGDFGIVPEKLTAAATLELADTRKGVDTVMEILSASNFEKGTVSFKMEKFDFVAAVRDELPALTKNASEKGVALHASLPDAPIETVGDKHKIVQHLIRNLIDNATKYSPKGSVDVSVSRTNDHYRFSVKDTGVGLTEDDKKILFTEGGKGKDSLRVNVESTGYGLYIAKQIAEAHKGKIWAESEGRGKGSLFVVELPLNK